MKFLIFLVILVASGCSTNQMSNKKKAMLHLKIGTSHLSKANYPSALEELLIARRLDPKSAIIRNNLGLAYLVRKRFVKAEFHIKKAVELDPKYTEAKNNLGRVYVYQKKHNKSIKVLRAALNDLTYKSPEKTYSNLGIAYFHSKRFKKAKLSFKRSLEIRRDNCATFNWYGRALYALKEYEIASSSFDKASKLCKKVGFVEPMFYSAMSFYRQKKRMQAKARFEEILYLYPDSDFAVKAKQVLNVIRGQK